MVTLEWTAPINHTSDCDNSDIDETNHTRCTVNTYLITCWPTLNMFETSDKPIIEINSSVVSTTATFPAGREERYSCSVQARNMCQRLSNESMTVFIYITGKNKINVHIITR